MVVERAHQHNDPSKVYGIYGVPRGGIPCAILVQRTLEAHEVPSFLTEDPTKADFIIDDIQDSGFTRSRFQQLITPSKPFLPLFSKDPTAPPVWFTFPWERMGKEDKAEDNVRRILQAIGEDPEREGLRETPTRVVKSWGKLFGGYSQSPNGIIKTFQDGACDEMVILRDIEFYSTCEHHMLPFFGKAHIGYLPNKKVVGISKLARLLEVFSRRLQIQERIGQQVTEALMEILQPQGAGCVLEAQHFCMTARGVEKQDSIMVTSSMRGGFRDDHTVKSEFLRMIGR
jgi:GTP cyclohydrolase I